MGRLGGILGPSSPSWKPSWPSWRHFGGHLGRLGGHLGRLGALLGRLGALLGPSWGPFGGLLGPLGAVLGRREAEKVETPKSFQNLKKSNEFCLLGPSWECSWRPLRASRCHLRRLGAILWHLGALLYHLGGLLALLGALWRASRAAPRRKTISGADPLGTFSGYFSSGDPQGLPRAREVEIL